MLNRDGRQATAFILQVNINSCNRFWGFAAKFVFQ